MRGECNLGKFDDVYGTDTHTHVYTHTRTWYVACDVWHVASDMWLAVSQVAVAVAVALSRVLSSSGPNDMPFNVKL